MQVIFHLQTRTPAILPPICDLFGLAADTVEGRPLHRGREADMTLLEVGSLHFKFRPALCECKHIAPLASSRVATGIRAEGPCVASLSKPRDRPGAFEQLLRPVHDRDWCLEGQEGF